MFMDRSGMLPPKTVICHVGYKQWIDLVEAILIGVSQ